MPFYVEGSLSFKRYTNIFISLQYRFDLEFWLNGWLAKGGVVEVDSLVFCLIFGLFCAAIWPKLHDQFSLNTVWILFTGLTSNINVGNVHINAHYERFSRRKIIASPFQHGGVLEIVEYSHSSNCSIYLSIEVSSLLSS